MTIITWGRRVWGFLAALVVAVRMVPAIYRWRSRSRYGRACAVEVLHGVGISQGRLAVEHYNRGMAHETSDFGLRSLAALDGRDLLRKAG